MVREPKASVFVASEEDAAKGGLSAVADGVSGADIRSVSYDVIAALHYSLLSQPYDSNGIDPNILGSHHEVFVYDELHGGWLFRFPNEIVTLLAKLKGKALESVASRWVGIFSAHDPQVGQNQIANMLKQIVIIAKTSNRVGKPMFWLASGC